MMKSLLAKLSIGTAQFGLDYGVSNLNGRTPKLEVEEIFRHMQKIGINECDTAQTYGNSEDLIGSLKTEKEIKVVTKFSLGETYEFGYCLSYINKSRLRLKTEFLYGMLLHNFNDYMKFPELWSELKDLKNLGLVKKIGFSIYEPDELKVILDEDLRPDIIQIPFSIFDQRFKKYFELVNSSQIEIYTRSSFMQGLLFIDPKKIPHQLDFCRVDIEKLRRFSVNTGLSINALCLNYVLIQEEISKVVIGVTTLNELKNNIELLKNADSVRMINAEIGDLALSTSSLQKIMQNLIKIQITRGNQKN